MLMKVLVLFVCVLASAVSLDIPSYLVPCSRSDPACLPKSATNTLKGLIKGDKKLKITPIDPLFLPLVEIIGNNLNLTLKKLNVYGLNEANIKSLKIDTDKHTGEVIMTVPKLEFICDYALVGKILVLELNGNDKGNITATDFIITWNFNYEPVEKNGEKYAKIVKDDTKFEISRAYFQFDDLFKGQDQLTASTNEVLNAEWSSVIKDLGAGISGAIGNVFRTVTSSFFDNIPFDKLYTP